jgi:hypothetical protein
MSLFGEKFLKKFTSDARDPCNNTKNNLEGIVIFIVTFLKTLVTNEIDLSSLCREAKRDCGGASFWRIKYHGN